VSLLEGEVPGTLERAFFGLTSDDSEVFAPTEHNRRPVSSLSRSAFLAGTAAAAAWPGVGLAQDVQPLHVAVDGASRARPVGADFIGLSYETKALWWGELKPDPVFVALLHDLGAGNLRIGGNQVEFGIWSEDGKPQMTDQRDYPIGPDDARKLAAIAEGAGWSVTAGIALGHGEPRRSAAQAAGWQAALGPRLAGIELGNEPDTFYRKVRPENYAYADYAREWRQYAAVIDGERRVRAPYTGPASAHDTYAWTIPFATEFKGRIATLSHHYYHGTSLTNPTIAQLMTRDALWPQRLADLIAAANADGIPFRLAETNSISRGGTAGVSDTFAATLWGIRHMAQLLNMGGAGINFHGGGPAIYSAIHWDAQTGFTARPLYVALQAVAAMLPGRVHPAGAVGEGPQSDPNQIDVLAIERNDGVLSVLVGNAAAKPRLLTLDANRRFGQAAVRRITAPSLDATTGVTFGAPEAIAASGSTVTLPLPALSAALVELR
jgi:hypothetical protein